MVTVQLTEEDAELFKDFQRDYYWYRPLKEAIKKHNIRSGHLEIKFHFNNLGEVTGVSTKEVFEQIKVMLPI